MIVSDAIGTAIERAYGAFAREPRPLALVASPLRNADNILGTLTTAPLRALSADQIGGYAGWAMTTVGTASDYRHFLPRILELAIFDPEWLGAEPAIIASKLKMARWKQWDPDQREAVSTLFESAFFNAVDAPIEAWSEPEDWLCGLANLDWAIAPLLDHWVEARSIGAALRLASFVRRRDGDLRRDRSLSFAFWEEVNPELQSLVGEWLSGSAVRHRLGEAIDRVPPDDRWEIEQALEVLDSV